MMNYETELADLEVELYLRQLARNNLREFIPYVSPGYDSQWFHDVMADELQQVYYRQTQRLMLFVPPQHGKSEISTRSFPAWVLGKNPDTKLVVTSYSATLASSFNRDIQRRMDDDPYRCLFPQTKLSQGHAAQGTALRNSEIFEVVGRKGFVKTVGVGGSLTGTPVDIGIIDDPIKDRQDAQSLTIREALWNWYTDVFETRLHNGSAQVLIQTRWHEDDLAGRLLMRDGILSDDNPLGWRVVSFPALRTEDENSFDPRPVGQALWPERHSQVKLERVRDNSPVTFNSLYQQDPRPSAEALVYPDWRTIEDMPYTDVTFYGLDFGFSNDPTALTRIGKHGNRLYLDELIYQPGLTTADLSERMKHLGLTRRDEIIADSADPRSIEELRRLGWNVKPAIKGPDSVSAGIMKLREFQVAYTLRSQNLAREVKNYQWIMLGGKPTNVPIDAFNHALDGVRYGVYTKYQRPPMTIRLTNRRR